MSGAPLIRRLVGDRVGLSAVEFALVAPIMIMLLFGGFAVTQGVAIARKVTLTTRTLADLVSRSSALTATQMATIKAASTQILAPYNPAPFGLRISQITLTSVAGITVALVSWSTATGLTPYQAGIAIQLPTGMPTTIGFTYILAETTYAYAPPFGSQFVGTINLGDRIFMLPRVSAAVIYTGA